MTAIPSGAPGPEEAPRRWEGLDERWVVDTSERQPVFLLTGRNGSRLRLSESAHQLLRLKSDGVTSEAIAEALRRTGKEVSAEEIEARYRKLLDSIEAIERGSNANPMGFWFRIRLLPQALVVRIVSHLTPAFQPATAALLLAFVVLSAAWLVALRPPIAWSGSSFWIGYALLLVSVLIHELGHASACAHFGAKPSDIGATLYLIYPALYSDVSAAWHLPRRQRVVVDVGGLYFQFVAGAVYAVAYALSGWQPFWVAVLMILGSSVFSFNPIFKFDGYWMLADSLGVTNLSRQPSRILAHTLRRLRGRPTEPLPWSAAMTATLACYSVLSFAVWGWFLWMLGPRLASIVAGLPPQVAAFIHRSPDAKLSSLLMSVFMAGLTLFISWRMVRSLLLNPLMNAVRRLKQRREAGRMVPTEAS